ncbi:metallophosphoesterase [Bdellovibrio bacteriovorus]|uniref:metallophosphoesterase n=1 Tax=Bdellovibrio bacteriovorus TaxID=959 RepID=UPI003AA7C3BB
MIKRLKAFLMYILVFVGGILAAWAFWLEPSSLTTQRYSLTMAHKSNFSPLRIGIVSDIHIGRFFGDEKRLERIVGTLNDEKPDIIVFLGDFVAQKSAEAFVKSAHQLKKLEAPLGVYAVLGNHDWWSGKTDVVQALTTNNVQLIDNQHIDLNWKGAQLRLIGLGDYWEDEHMWDYIAAHKASEIPSIAITHNPDVFPRIPSDISLVLAGHTHGGQVNFPIINSPIVPSQFQDRYRYGLIHEDDHHLLVTSGTGNSILPVRFRVPPEVVIAEVAFTSAN